MINSSSKDVHVPLRLRIDVARQRLEVLRDTRGLQIYPVSTSRFGLGFEPGSNKTPLGRFVVGEKIGAGVAIGAVFRSRMPTGQIALQGGEEDLILTRILWLDRSRRRECQHQGSLHLHPRHQPGGLPGHSRQSWLCPNEQRRYRRVLRRDSRRDASRDRRVTFWELSVVDL